MTEIKEPVRIRKKKLANQNFSLYLDIYYQGKRKYEFLKLYLIPERTKEDRQKNKQTLLLANAIKANRIVELQSGKYGMKAQPAEEICFFDYFRSLLEKRRTSASQTNWENWRACLKHLEQYEPNARIPLSQITSKWINGFCDYLEHRATAWGCDSRKRAKGVPLSPNSRHSYFCKLKACIRQAFEEGYLPSNPMLRVERPKTVEVNRMYLTMNEIRTLSETPCHHATTKQMFLFSCLTGLRRSDIVHLTWQNVQQQGNFTRIIFKQKKTSGQEYLDITPQAAKLMGPRGESNEPIFKNVYTPSNTNQVIKRWISNAGICKNITFHCARHSFAVMMLDLETDIYTVSKLLGHRDLSTTQIYAKILDKNKQAAVSRIPDLLK